jgi:hypothetical protein
VARLELGESQTQGPDENTRTVAYQIQAAKIFWHCQPGWHKDPLVAQLDQPTKCLIRFCFHPATPDRYRR